jgi:hypothetical protein
MSRIRSIHPGLFTDEAFMSLTVEAPLACPLLLGLWCEADDAGTFEWKPLTIKARILPAASPDVNQLLAALVSADVIKQFEIDGKRFGVIRNFVKFQRPKEPKVVHPSSPESLAYAGFEANGARPRSGTGRPPGTTSELLPKSPGSPSEKGCQREDVGGRREDEDEGGNNSPSLRSGEPPEPPAEEKSGPKRKTEISADAQITAKQLAIARKLELTNEEAEFEFNRFRDSARAHRRTYVDWNAAYRNWLTSPYGILAARAKARLAKPQTNTSFLLNINGDFYDEPDSSVPFERSSAAYVAGFGESGEGVPLASPTGGFIDLLAAKTVGSG